MTNQCISGSQLLQLVTLNRRFGVLCANGITLLQALAILQQEATGIFVEVIGAVQARVEAGESLAAAMAAYPRLFPAIYLEWVRQAEASGALDVGAQEAAELLEPVAIADNEAVLGWERIESAVSLIQFTRRCAELLEKGLEWWRVFYLLTLEAPPNFARLVHDLMQRRDDQRQWLALWQRMEEYPNTFSLFYRNMTRLGWESRTFDETVHFLADLLYEDWRFAQVCHCFTDRPSLIIDLGQPPLADWATLTPNQARLTTMLFFRAFSMLLAAGHSREDALAVCATLLPGVQQQTLLTTAGQDDQSLADLLPFFPPFTGALLRAGEQRGRIEYSCNQIAEVIRGEMMARC